MLQVRPSVTRDSLIGMMESREIKSLKWKHFNIAEDYVNLKDTYVNSLLGYEGELIMIDGLTLEEALDEIYAGLRGIKHILAGNFHVEITKDKYFMIHFH